MSKNKNTNAARTLNPVLSEFRKELGKLYRNLKNNPEKRDLEVEKIKDTFLRRITLTIRSEAVTLFDKIIGEFEARELKAAA
ncbi:MAG: hypothetical protein ABIH35_02925 [Patescibacteria group bacterium]